jgi:hypothetical protein
MEPFNLANNQVSHNTKIKSGKEIRQSNPLTNILKIYGHSTKWSDGKKKGWKSLNTEFSGK